MRTAYPEINASEGNIGMVLYPLMVENLLKRGMEVRNFLTFPIHYKLSENRKNWFFTVLKVM